jgi:hypothetical protein
VKGQGVRTGACFYKPINTTPYQQLHLLLFDELDVSNCRFALEMHKQAGPFLAPLVQMLYLMRFKINFEVPPVDPLGLVIISTSSEMENERFWSIPTQLGNVAASGRTAKEPSFSLTV